MKSKITIKRLIIIVLSTIILYDIGAYGIYKLGENKKEKKSKKIAYAAKSITKVKKYAEISKKIKTETKEKTNKNPKKSKRANYKRTEKLPENCFWSGKREKGIKNKKESAKNKTSAIAENRKEPPEKAIEKIQKETKEETHIGGIKVIINNGVVTEGEAKEIEEEAKRLTEEIKEEIEASKPEEGTDMEARIEEGDVLLKDPFVMEETDFDFLAESEILEGETISELSKTLKGFLYQ